MVLPQAKRRGKWIELVVGIVLGLLIGVALAYVLVIVVGGGRDASEISTPRSSPPKQAPAKPGSNG